jgi:endonuclease YncB( thermonuclease family)
MERNKFLDMESSRSTLHLFALALAMLALCLPALAAGKVFRGPVQATVVEVLDGDTFLAEASVWPGQTIRVNIRIRGIDAPELKARCDSERAAALRAREALVALFGDKTVAISNIAGAKYYGRVLADVTTSDGSPVASILLGERLVRRYSGGRRDGWCG